MAPLEACGEPCIHVYPGKAGMLRALDGRLRGGFSSINPGFRGPKTRDIPGDFTCRAGRSLRGAPAARVHGPSARRRGGAARGGQVGLVRASVARLQSTVACSRSASARSKPLAFKQVDMKIYQVCSQPVSQWICDGIVKQSSLILILSTLLHAWIKQIALMFSLALRSRVLYPEDKGGPSSIFFSSSARCGSTYKKPLGHFARLLWTEVTSALRFFTRESVSGRPPGCVPSGGGCGRRHRRHGTRTWLSLQFPVGNTREGGWCVYAVVERVWGRKFRILGAWERWGCWRWGRSWEVV